MGYHIAQNWRLNNVRYGNAEGGLNGSKCPRCGRLSVGEGSHCPPDCAEQKLAREQNANNIISFKGNEKLEQAPDSEMIFEKAAR